MQLPILSRFSQTLLAFGLIGALLSTNRLSEVRGTISTLTSQILVQQTSRMHAAELSHAQWIIIYETWPWASGLPAGEVKRLQAQLDRARVERQRQDDLITSYTQALAEKSEQLGTAQAEEEKYSGLLWVAIGGMIFGMFLWLRDEHWSDRYRTAKIASLEARTALRQLRLKQMTGDAPPTSPTKENGSQATRRDAN